jgi:hypothetical protein
MSEDPPNTLLVKDVPGLEKMSELLTELVKPWLEECTTDADRRVLFQIGMVAWNFALLPEDKRSEAMQVTTGNHSPELAKTALDMIKLLIARKLKLFPTHRRQIFDFELLKLPSGKLHINVKSSAEDMPLPGFQS